MNVHSEQVRLLGSLQGLVFPEDDLNNIALRLSTWLTAMEEIEKEMGAQMNLVEPIPPIFPREEF